MQPNFFAQKFLEKGYAKELYHVWYTKIENSIKDGGLVPGEFQSNTKEDKLFVSHIRHLSG